MALLVDLFGYLSIVVHGLTIMAQSMALGGVLFLVCLARPLAWLLGADGDVIVRRVARLAAWSALALIVCEAATVALEGSVLVGTIDLAPSEVLAAQLRAGRAHKDGRGRAACAAAVRRARAARRPCCCCCWRWWNWRRRR